MKTSILFRSCKTERRQTYLKTRSYRITTTLLCKVPRQLLTMFFSIIVIGVMGHANGSMAGLCGDTPASGYTTKITLDDIDRSAQDRFQKIELAETTRRVLLLSNSFRTVEYGNELFGLASFYNTYGILRLSSNASVVDPEDLGFSSPLGALDWVGAVGRFDVLMLSAPGAIPTLLSDGSMLLCYQDAPPGPIAVYFGDKSEAESVAPIFAALRFPHLWSGLAHLSWIVTIAIEFIGNTLGGAWGWAIIIFGLILKILLLPINIMTGRLQRQVALHQTALEPKIKSIKERYDGEEAHNLIIASYKERGITPFYTLKPMAGALIQVPILIAIFNALAEMPQLHGASFLWIEDLAVPDVVGNLSFAIPLLGDTINLLPLLMTVITIVSTSIFTSSYATAKSLKDQKRNLYLMCGVFLLLFYPFPAAMVLYWTIANLLQFIQQETVRLCAGLR